jgi:hypothetical protein
VYFIVISNNIRAVIVGDLGHPRPQPQKKVYFVTPEKPIEEPASKDAFTQSDYRESEAQTEPYTPEYILREDDPNPMVLALDDMKFLSVENGGQIGV